jgi:hypothetical protein
MSRIDSFKKDGDIGISSFGMRYDVLRMICDLKSKMKRVTNLKKPASSEVWATVESGQIDNYFCSRNCFAIE